MQDLADLVNQPSFWDYFFSGNTLALLGAAMALILSGYGSCKGVMMVGNAAAPVVADDPSKFGKSIVLQALPGTQGLYGFVTAFVVLIKLDLFGTMKVLTVGQGSFILAACLPIAFIGYYSAIKQASVAVSGISILAKRPDQFMKGVISAALVETYAAFAFLVSLLVLLQFNI